MSFLRMMGFGEKKIFAENLFTQGCVTDVKKCWWIKVNTKPVRRDMWDGAMYPHIITFTYAVNGVQYTGRRFVPHDVTPPAKGQLIRAYYSADAPQKYAVK